MEKIYNSAYIPILVTFIGRGGGRSRRTTSTRRSSKDRIVFIGTAIEDSLANSVIAQLLFLEAEDSDEDLFIYIDGPGGVVSAGSRSTTRCSTSPATFATICMGQAASMAAVLVRRERRENARFFRTRAS